MSKKLLVLDIDGTLIYGSADPPTDDSDYFMVIAQKQAICVQKRPGLDLFLKFCKENYDLAVWSSGTKEYVEKILAVIGLDVDSLKYFFTRNDCELRMIKSKSSDGEDRAIILKPLERIWRQGTYAASDVWILDDTPETYQDNMQNAIPIYSYRGEDEDHGLYFATRILKRALSLKPEEKSLDVW